MSPRVGVAEEELVVRGGSVSVVLTEAESVDGDAVKVEDDDEVGVYVVLSVEGGGIVEVRDDEETKSQESGISRLSFRGPASQAGLNLNL